MKTPLTPLAASTPNPLVPHWPELIIGSIAFLIVFALLAKVLMPRISATLAERTDAIEGGLKRAEDAQEEAKRVLAQYRAQLADARQRKRPPRSSPREGQTAWPSGSASSRRRAPRSRPTGSRR
jgi:F-type H+-transporting ATPase subunit b